MKYDLYGFYILFLTSDAIPVLGFDEIVQEGHLWILRSQIASEIQSVTTATYVPKII